MDLIISERKNNFIWIVTRKLYTSGSHFWNKNGNKHYVSSHYFLRSVGQKSPFKGLNVGLGLKVKLKLLSRVQLFATPWIAARQASLSITNSRSSRKLTSIELVMPSNHLILCRPLLLLPPIPPSIRVFSNGSTLLLSQIPASDFIPSIMLSPLIFI